MVKIKKGLIKKRRAIVLVLISSLVLILGAAGWWYFMQGKNSTTERSTREVTDMSEVGSIADDGRRLAAEKDVAGGEAKFDTALQSTQDDNVTLQLLFAKIQFYLDANEIDKALATAKDADKQFPNTMGVYAALANIYEVKGAKQEAIAEYRRALDVLGDETNADPNKPAASRANPREYYEARIQELER